MKLDRTLQLDLLNRLAEAYPKTVQVQTWLKESENVNPNLHYLSQHDLIDGSVSQELGGSVRFLQARINAKGLDFLADDGGLSAILGVVTVKIHQDTIRQMLLQRVASADMPPEEKATLVEKIRALPGKGFEKLTEKLLEKGADGLLEQAPRLLDLLSQIG
jgi:hypothetical protein